MTPPTDPPTPDASTDAVTDNSEADAAEWDSEYADHDEQMWSGNANGSLVEMTRAMSTGRALDIGCGEGADAIFLAANGWTVTAIDISSVAIDRAASAGTRAGVEVEWVNADVIADPPAPAAFDLVAWSYPSFRRDDGLEALPALAAALAPGGCMLVLGHANVDPALAKERGWDPADFLSLDDIVATLGPELTIELDDVRDRPNPPEGTPHLEDRVLILRRSS